MKGKILIVDDVPDNVEVLTIFLRARGYETLSAYSGGTGFDDAVREVPDLILLDVMMDDLDGYTVCRMLRENAVTRSIPVIFVSARASDADLAEGRSAGGVDYVTKPFNFRDVAARIERALQGARVEGR